MSCPVVSSPLCSVIHLMPVRSPCATCVPQDDYTLDSDGELISCFPAGVPVNAQRWVKGRTAEVRQEQRTVLLLCTFLACYSALALWGHSFPLLIASHSLSSLFPPIVISLGSEFPLHFGDLACLPQRRKNTRSPTVCPIRYLGLQLEFNGASVGCPRACFR